MKSSIAQQATVTQRTVLIGSLPAAALSSTTAAGAKTASAPSFSKGATPMRTITTKDGVEIFYKDWGGGQPIVFSHGWPLVGR